MAETCLLAEATICYPPLFNELRSMTQRPTPTSETVAMAAVAAAIEQNAGAIIVMSTSGNTARLVSKFKPPCPIITITRNEQTSRQIHLHRGCYPMYYEEPKPTSDEGWQVDVDNRIRYGLSRGLELGIVRKNDTIVAIQGWRAGGGSTNTVSPNPLNSLLPSISLLIISLPSIRTDACSLSSRIRQSSHPSSHRELKPLLRSYRRYFPSHPPLQNMISSLFFVTQCLCLFSSLVV